MQTYDIKRGHLKAVEGDKLPALMKEVFGNVAEEEGFFASNYCAMAPIKARVASPKTLEVDIKVRLGLSDEDNVKTNTAKNRFLEAATGMSAKERAKRAQQKAKKGLL